jgi:hypothetical protein
MKQKGGQKQPEDEPFVELLASSSYKKQTPDGCNQGYETHQEVTEIKIIDNHTQFMPQFWVRYLQYISL